MNNVIKASPILKVLKPNEVVMLNKVYEYKTRIEEETKTLLARTQQECVMLKEELELANKKQLEDFSSELYKDNRHQLDKLLTELEQNLHFVVSKILYKLQINSFSHQQITNTIKNELQEIISNQKMQVQCNDASLELIKSDLLDLDTKVTYQINNTLRNEQCIINTGMSLIYIDIAQCRNTINEILSIPDKDPAQEN